MKRLGAAALALTLCVCSLAGCGKAGKREGGLDALPEYNEEKRMVIGGWDSPKPTLKNYQIAADMGITMMYVDKRWGDMGSQIYTDTLAYCEEVGIKAMLQSGNSLGEGGKAFDRTTDYSKFPAVEGINFFDEPFKSDFPALEELVIWYNEKYGETQLDWYCNLLPMGDTGFDSYEQYVDTYCKDIMSKAKGTKWLSVDLYPLLNGPNGSRLNTNWLPVLELFAEKAVEYEADHFLFFILGTKHYNYREVSEEDLRYQFWVNMAYGADSISYFTYRDSVLDGYDISFVDLNGNIHAEKYYAAQKVNREFLAMDDTYLSFDWKETMTVTGTESDEDNQSFENLTRSVDMVAPLKSVTATRDTLIGAFKDEADNDGLVVANFSDPYYGESDRVDLTFRSANRAIVWKNGVKKVYEVKDDKLTLDLAAGEGAFVIPVWLNV